jgi:patatin-like phospholipase/acyl hydrolase
MAVYRILSLDGGGIKGLFTATLLDRLVQRWDGLLERVDLLAGTSTGAILALGLAQGMTPAELAELYRSQAGTIFDDSVVDDLVDLGTALGADYDHAGLQRLLEEAFGETTLADLSKRVLIPAFHLDAPARGERPRMWKPKFFHNFPGEDSDAGERVVDVALRSSSAPTYFPSYQGYVDGGLVANNPSIAAVAQALDERAEERVLEDIVLLSVSTGTEPKRIEGADHDWGWVRWAKPLVSLMISGVMGVADFQAKQLLRKRYFRLDAHFDRGVDLDDKRPETLAYLMKAAQDVPEQRLDEAVAWLQEQRW